MKPNNSSQNIKQKTELLESTWSDNVANDPKHRPQFFNRLSTTVRKEWCRRPQEAHVADGDKYRRLSVAEIAVIQGFDPGWVQVDGLTENEKIAVLGNAVAPPVARAIGSVLLDSGFLKTLTSVEICAGIGGLSLGFPYLQPIAKIEIWDIACKVLKTHFPPKTIFECLAQDYDFASLKGKVGLLCGGPPCQPWSQAGTQLGHEDPRDVMGFTPLAVASCEPDVFIFENVPGLLSSNQHDDYRKHLWSQLRNPKPGLTYGLDYKVLDAADYGVPQHRKRVFIVGVKNESDAKVRRLLSKVIAASTHHDPEKPAYQKLPWITLGEALKNIKSEHPWRKWNIFASENNESIVDAESEEIIPSDIQPSSIASRVAHETTDLTKIGFWWPKKEFSLNFSDGRWRFEPKEKKRDVKAIIFDGLLVAASPPPNIAVVQGDYAPTIDALSPIVKGTVKFVYCDMPRLNADGEFTQHVDIGFARSAWMSFLRDASKAARKLMGNQSFIAIQTDEESAHYARMVMDETFGHENHVTTFAWEKKYSAQNDRNTPTDSFDYIAVYSTINKDSITEKIGLVVDAKKIIDDGDFRGCYTAGHKGARSGSEKTKFKVNMPPYRWKILESSLPECEGYVFDSITGVLYIASVKQVGRFFFNVECEDASGEKAIERIEFEIRERRDRTDIWEEPESIWWLIKNKENEAIVSGGELVSSNNALSVGIIGSDYSIVLRASGGNPFVGSNDQPGAGRFWEFGQSTLVSLVAKAAASFGKKGMALPSEKKFMSRTETTKRISVRNWLPWHIGGKSEDATRHLKNLANAGYGSPIAQSFAKPETLAYYLIQLFAPDAGDTILSIGDDYATMSSAAIKSGRTAIHLVGPSASNIDRWEKTASERLRAVIEGKDLWGISSASTDDDDPFVQAVPAPLSLMHLSASSIIRKGLREVEINLDPSERYENYIAALRGFLPDLSSPTGFSDRNGNRCLVISPDEILDEMRVSESESMIPNGGTLTIMFERSDLHIEIKQNPQLILIRIPFEI